MVDVKSMVLCMVYMVKVKTHIMRFDMMKYMDGDMVIWLMVGRGIWWRRIIKVCVILWWG